MLCCESLRRNILPEMSATYLKNCQRVNDSLCPIFRLGDMVREAGENFREMAVEVSSPHSQWIEKILLQHFHALFLFIFGTFGI